MGPKRVDALSCSTVHLAIKLGHMHLRMAEAQKREAKAITETKSSIAKVEREYRARMEELRKQANS